jgi:hypothetical protein
MSAHWLAKVPSAAAAPAASLADDTAEDAADPADDAADETDDAADDAAEAAEDAVDEVELLQPAILRTIAVDATDVRTVFARTAICPFPSWKSPHGS